MQSDALDLASPIVLHADVRGDRRGRVPDESLLHSARRLRQARWCLHAGVTAVSWQAHGGEPVLDAFWATCSGTDVAITGSLHGVLRFWSAAHLLEAACLQQPNQVRPQVARHAHLEV